MGSDGITTGVFFLYDEIICWGVGNINNYT